MNIYFILPGGGRCGGIRVTMEMANALLLSGHQVQILVHLPKINIFNKIKGWIKNSYHFFYKENDWLDFFKGEIVFFKRLNDVKFQSGDIVIAIGTYSLVELFNLNKPVIKVKYCHGLPGDKLNPRYAYLKYPIPTISVSQALVPMLEQEAGIKVLGVVPNGIDPKQYYIMPEINRDGFGIIYGITYEKAPVEILCLLKKLKIKFNKIPQYCFGQPKCPRQLSADNYWRFPSISKAREIYNRSRIWFIASRNEGFCLPILEAMACGCVVISSNHENASSLIDHDVNGFIVEFGDIDAYLYYANKILNDSCLRGKIVKNSQQTVKQYTWDKAVQKMERILEELNYNIPNE